MTYHFPDYSFNVFDVTDPSDPLLTGSCPMQTYTYDMVVSDQYAFVTEYADGIEVVNISDPESPFVEAVIPTEYACEVTVAGNLIYIADYYSVKIMDLSDLSEPVTLAEYDSVEKAKDLWIDGSYLYIADSDFGLRILNEIDPSSPELVRDYAIDYCGDVVIVDHYAYVSGGSFGVQICDVIDPANPVFQMAIPSAGWMLSELDGRLYVQEGWSELQIWDVSTPPAHTRNRATAIMMAL